MNKFLISALFSLFSLPLIAHDPSDPFKRMQKIQDLMRAEMDKVFQDDSFFSPGFGMGINRGGGVEISQREDDQYKYVDVILKEEEKKNLNIKVEKGMITISSQREDRNQTERDGNMSSSTYISSFNQSISVPQGVRESEAMIENKEDKITIKFPKKIKKI